MTSEKRPREYRLGTYGGRVQRSTCYRCRAWKLTRNEPSLGRGVRICKPCLAKLQEQS